MVVKYGSYSFDNDRRVFLIVEFSTEKSQASSRSRVKLASALRNRRQIALMHTAVLLHKVAKLITVVCGGSCFHSLSGNRHSSVCT